MVNHKEIEQNSIEWHEIKWCKIGGTLSKGLFIDSDTLFLELLSQPLEEFEPSESFENYDMIRGKELEPEARLQLSKYTGYNFLECGFIQNPIKLLGISPDGITADFKIQCEIKCPDANQHLKTCVSNSIPQSNIHQCIHAFTVNDNLETFFFLSFRPESIKPMFVKELTRESLVNIGTKAKPIIKTINEVVALCKKRTEELELDLKTKIEQLKF